MGEFDTLATLVTDLGNAALTIVSTLLTGTNASTILYAVVVLTLISIFFKIPQKVMGKYFKRE